MDSQSTAERREGGRRTGDRRSGFTLIELMIVIAIMGIVLAMGVPSIKRVFRTEPLAKTVDEMRNVCLTARQQAIMQGEMAEVIFHAREGRLDVVGGGGQSEGGTGEAPRQMAAGPDVLRSAQIPEDIGIAMLKVNGVSYMDAETARIRFYPNGTSDELYLILMRPSDRKTIGIYLEVTTGLPDLELDPNKLADQIR